MYLYLVYMRLQSLEKCIGTVVTVYKKFLHLREEVCAKYPNANKGCVLDHLLVVRTEEKTVNKRQQLCVIMRHVNFDDGLLLYYAVARYCKAQIEGPTEHFFNDTSLDKNPVDVVDVTAAVGEEGPVEGPEIFNGDNASHFCVQVLVLMMIRMNLPQKTSITRWRVLHRHFFCTLSV